MITNFKEIYDQEALEKDPAVNANRPYQQCAISVMDTIADPDITFDEQGISNYYHEYESAEKSMKERVNAPQSLEKLVEELKNRSKKSEYDGILGLSGGVDSSYLAHLLKSLGLNPLLVHFDYGWNSDIAVQNISRIVRKTGFELHTVVMDWEEFKDLQRSYFKSSVLDLDVPADHMIFGALHKMANQFNINSIFNGYNVVTEQTLPPSWSYDKFDITNLQNIQAKFGSKKLKMFPKMGFMHRTFYGSIKVIQQFSLLNYVDFNKEDAIAFIEKEFKWRNYGGKHHESVFTRFYQGYSLPYKFNIDKRKAHLSTTIFSGQITKEEALIELSNAPYALEMMAEDKEYVGKKLGFTPKEFDAVLNLPNVAHEYYGTDQAFKKRYAKYVKYFRFTKPLLKKLMN